MSGENRTILLVEDERNDVFFLEYAFESAGITNPLQVVEDGQQAIDYFAGIGKFANRTQYPIPCLVVLDLKLPVKERLDVFGLFGLLPALLILLVIVLSSSRDPYDVDEAYRLGARSYLVKPLSMSERLEVAKAIKYYWLGLNELSRVGGCNKKE